MVTMDGLKKGKHQHALTRGLAACAMVAPLLMAGCTQTTETSYRLSVGQKDVALALASDFYRLTFFGMTQPVNLVLLAPSGTKFLANESKQFSLSLAVGQRQYVYFDVVSDGTLVKGKMLDARRIEFRAEGNDRPSALPQSFETRVWIQSNKYPPSRFVSVQYRYALIAAQNSMELNLGNFRHDPKSQFIVQGKAALPTLVLKAAPGETFVFVEKPLSLDTGDTVPVGATRANEYRIQMKPGQEKELHFWIAAQDDRVHMQKISIQYLPTL